jgi:hypothetical protein
MNLKSWLASMIGISSFAACGGNDLEDGVGNSPGTGTSTLVVEGRVRAEPRVFNAHDGIDFDTEYSVRVWLNNALVTTGEVNITSLSGTIALVFDPGENRWEGSGVRYDEVYILDVDSGSDYVHDVRVDGPSIFWFDEPLAGATVDSTMPLMVKWSTSEEADSIWIRATELDEIAITDTGSYSLAAGSLKAEPDKAQENEIRLSKTSYVIPAGAVGESRFAVTIENRIMVVAQPL